MKNHRPGSLDLQQVRERLYTRRQLLLAAAGGSLAALFGVPAGLSAAQREDPWEVIAQVQQHLFPDESESPGARAVNALAYLQGVMEDSRIPRDERDFVLRGVAWLQGMAQQRQASGFLQMSTADQDELLRRIARSEAGENWLSTLLTYLFEALLTAPAYGGNPGGVGWKWLEYVPGFPLPDADTVHARLPR
jgi:gluconate 2-dehydrogenase gamma chain